MARLVQSEHMAEGLHACLCWVDWREGPGGEVEWALGISLAGQRGVRLGCLGGVRRHWLQIQCSERAQRKLAGLQRHTVKVLQSTLEASIELQGSLELTKSRHRATCLIARERAQ